MMGLLMCIMDMEVCFVLIMILIEVWRFWRDLMIFWVIISISNGWIRLLVIFLKEII